LAFVVVSRFAFVVVLSAIFVVGEDLENADSPLYGHLKNESINGKEAALRAAEGNILDRISEHLKRLETSMESKLETITKTIQDTAYPKPNPSKKDIYPVQVDLSNLMKEVGDRIQTVENRITNVEDRVNNGGGNGGNQTDGELKCATGGVKLHIPDPSSKYPLDTVFHKTFPFRMTFPHRPGMISSIDKVYMNATRTTENWYNENWFYGQSAYALNTTHGSVGLDVGYSVIYPSLVQMHWMACP